MVPLLQKGLTVEQREEDAVQVDLQHLQEVLPVGGMKRVIGGVLARHRVASPQQIGSPFVEDSRLGETPAAFEHAVFQDVGHPGIVLGQGAEADLERMQLPLGFQMHQPGPAGPMVILACQDAEGIHA